MTPLHAAKECVQGNAVTLPYSVDEGLGVFYDWLWPNQNTASTLSAIFWKAAFEMWYTKLLGTS